MKTAILGWGSLLWDAHQEFEKHHGHWDYDGPILKLEFSRVSQSRSGALTLVIDEEHGSLCTVAYSLSKRVSPQDAICDLRCREGTTLSNIGCYFADGSKINSRDAPSLERIRSWAASKRMDVVVWTDLKSNFQEESMSHRAFSIDAALSHFQALNEKGRIWAAEYVRRAPRFVVTQLRAALQSESWFLDAERH